MMSENMDSAIVTDLCASRRGGAGRARAGPGSPGTRRGWSTGCLTGEDSLKTETGIRQALKFTSIRSQNCEKRHLTLSR